MHVRAVLPPPGVHPHMAGLCLADALVYLLLVGIPIDILQWFHMKCILLRY